MIYHVVTGSFRHQMKQKFHGSRKTMFCLEAEARNLGIAMQHPESGVGYL